LLEEAFNVSGYNLKVLPYVDKKAIDDGIEARKQ